MEGMNYQSKSNQCSFLRHPASECTNLLLKVGLYSGSLCSAQSFININGILSFIYSFSPLILSGHIFNPDPLNGLQTNRNIEESMLLVLL